MSDMTTVWAKSSTDQSAQPKTDKVLLCDSEIAVNSGNMSKKEGKMQEIEKEDEFAITSTDDAPVPGDTIDSKLESSASSKENLDVSMDSDALTAPHVELATQADLAEDDPIQDVNRLESGIDGDDTIGDADEATTEPRTAEDTTGHGADSSDVVAADIHTILNRHGKDGEAIQRSVAVKDANNEEARDAAMFVVVKWEKLRNNGVTDKRIFIDAAVQAVSLPYDSIEEWPETTADKVRKEVGQAAARAIEREVWTDTTAQDGNEATQMAVLRERVTESIEKIATGIESAIVAKEAELKQEADDAQALMQMRYSTPDNPPKPHKRKAAVDSSDTEPPAERPKKARKSSANPLSGPQPPNGGTLIGRLGGGNTSNADRTATFTSINPSTNKPAGKVSKSESESTTPKKVLTRSEHTEKWGPEEELFLLKAKASPEWEAKGASGQKTTNRKGKHDKWLALKGYKSKDKNGNTVDLTRSWNAMEQHLKKLGHLDTAIKKLEKMLSGDTKTEEAETTSTAATKTKKVKSTSKKAADTTEAEGVDDEAAVDEEADTVGEGKSQEQAALVEEAEARSG
ncbi:hypothetical protein LTR85_011275 [Meristemomyces frigidus]|nr:hypothetical protein LTR85_011275 [Meristemomyces frigidus]